ncbi:MAG: hypothetical protein U1E86_13595 [Burkholderiaceae bacterium]
MDNLPPLLPLMVLGWLEFCLLAFWPIAFAGMALGRVSRRPVTRWGRSHGRSFALYLSGVAVLAVGVALHVAEIGGGLARLAPERLAAHALGVLLLAASIYLLVKPPPAARAASASKAPKSA